MRATCALLGLAMGWLAVPSAGAQQKTHCQNPFWPAFGKLSGRWSVEGWSRGDAGHDDTGRLVAVIRVNAAGCLVVEETGGGIGMRRQGFLYAMSFAGERAQRVYYDTTHAQFLLFTQAKADPAILRFEWRQEANGRSFVSRSDIRLISPTAFRLDQYLSTDAGTNWTHVQQWRYRRAR